MTSNIVKITTSMLIVLGLAGCATGAQRQFAAMKANSASAGTTELACISAIYNSPEHAIIRPHAPMKTDDATLEQKMSTSFATDEEIKVILADHPAKHQCDMAFITQMGLTHPTITPILTDQLNKAEDNLIVLIQKKETWGDYVRRGIEITASGRVALSAEDQRIVGRLNEENQAELQQRAAAAAALGQALEQQAAQQQAIMAQQQALINANRPVYTNCNSYGQTTNCVSQ